MPVLERFALDGRKAVVTGGNQGLGKAFAAALAEAGADVVIVARDTGRNAAAARDLKSQGLTVSALDGDLTQDADAIIDAAAGQLGGLDILVNNAGVCYHGDVVAGHRPGVGRRVRPERPGAVAVQPGRRPAHGRRRRGLDHQRRLDLRR